MAFQAGPHDAIKRDDVGLQGALDVIRERIAGRETDSEVRLDLRGTEVQKALLAAEAALTSSPTQIDSSA